MSNYPSDIRQFDHDPRSPFFDDSAFEEAHTKKMQEISKDAQYIANVIAEMGGDKYCKMESDINATLGVIGRFMSDALASCDTDEWQLIVGKMYVYDELPPIAKSVVDDAISDYAAEAVKDEISIDDEGPEPDYDY